MDFRRDFISLNLFLHSIKKECAEEERTTLISQINLLQDANQLPAKTTRVLVRKKAAGPLHSDEIMFNKHYSCLKILSNLRLFFYGPFKTGVSTSKHHIITKKWCDDHYYMQFKRCTPILNEPDDCPIH